MAKEISNLITFNTYKFERGGLLVDMFNQFNARVGDQGTELAIQWETSKTETKINLKERELHFFATGSVGQYLEKLEDGTGFKMSADASTVSWEDKDGAGSLDDGITVAKLPKQFFPQKGIFFGYFGLKDRQGNIFTSVNVWFRVLGGVPTMGAAIPYFVTEFDEVLERCNGKIVDALAELREKYQAEVKKNEDMSAETRAALSKLADAVGAIQAQIDAGNVVTLKKHNEDIQKLGNEIDNRLDQIHQEVETFADLDSVKAKYPQGKDGIFVLDDGHRAIYRNDQWSEGPVYQSAGIANNSVKTVHTDFARHRHNIYNQDEALTGIYNAVDGKVAYQGTNANKRYGDFTCFKFKISDQRTFTVPGTDFNILGSTDDGTLAWSDNQSNGVTGTYTFTVPSSVVYVYVTFLTDSYGTYYCFAGGLDYDSAGQFLLNAPLASPLAKEVVAPEMTTFVLGKGNLYSDSKSFTGIYNAVNGKVVYQNKLVNQHFGDFICFKFRTNGHYTFTVSGTDFTTLGGLKDGTLAWSDNYNDGVTGPYTFSVPTNVYWVYVTFKPSTYSSFKAVEGRDLSASGYRLADNIKIPSIINQENRLDVGKNFHFTRLIDAVNEAKAHASQSSPYVIYIHDDSIDHTGTTYNLLNELGGIVYLSSIENASDNMQGFHIPAYVSLIGVGKITLLAELPDGVSLAQSTNFSTIELEEGNNRLEGLTIRIRNGRYAVHDESRDKYPNAYHIFKNVRFVHEGNLQGLWDVQDAYAAGTSAGCTYSFTNCIFDVSKSNGYPFSMHNYAPQLGSTVTFDGIKLISNANRPVSLRFGFNGYSPVTDDPNKYEACYTNVFIKNAIGNGEILIEPETNKYNCTNNYRLYNFTSLKEDSKDNQIK
ncbi:hypothetical protein HHK02_06840 [Limosilactobacillus reuteri]|uniref:BppU N-terminal domain-containing protein n=1 Tax=Limosilactobacillus reuteri TaxID=1598 RepID=A0A7L6BGA4_LIMRT|nr:hypothetical protein [Limosilactobacillus reuteri]QLQ60940.1 hypothetical protein HHK02_06840 [Limosilactobacillus reuteri]